MRIANLIELKSGIISNIESYVCIDDQLEHKILEEIETAFKEKIIEHEKSNPVSSEEDLDNYIQYQEYDDFDGYNICITWSSYVNTQ